MSLVLLFLTFIIILAALKINNDTATGLDTLIGVGAVILALVMIV